MSSMLNEDRNEIDQLGLIGKYILKPEAEPQDDNDDDWHNGNFSDTNMDTCTKAHSRKTVDTMNMSLHEEFYNTNNNNHYHHHHQHHHPVEIDDKDLDLHQVGYFDQSSIGYGHMYTQQSIENQLNDESYKNLEMEFQNQYNLNPDSDDFEDEEFNDPLNVPIFTVMDAYHAFTMRKRVEEANQQWGTGMVTSDEDLTSERRIKVQFCEDVQFFAINSRADDEEEELNYAMTENRCVLNESSNFPNVLESEGTEEIIQFEEQPSSYHILEKISMFDSDEVPKCPVSTPVSSQSDLDLNENTSISDFQISSNSSNQSLQISSQEEIYKNSDYMDNKIISMDDNINNNNNFDVYNTNATEMEIPSVEFVENPLQPTPFQNVASSTLLQSKIKNIALVENSKTKIRKTPGTSTRKTQNDQSKNNNSTFNYNNVTTQLLRNAEDRESIGKKQLKKKPIGEGAELSFLSTLSKEPTQTSKLRNLLKASKYAIRKNIENNRSNSQSSSSSSMYSNNFNLIISSDSKSHLGTPTHLSSSTSSHTKVKKLETRSNNNNMSTFPLPNKNNTFESSPINPILQSILDTKTLSVLSKSKSCTQSNIVLRELKTQILRHKIQKSTLEQKLSKRIINLIYNDSSLSSSSNNNSGQPPPPTSYHQQTLSSKSKTKNSVSSRNTSASAVQSQPQSFQNHSINFSGRSSKWASRPDFISFAKKLESLRTSDQSSQQKFQQHQTNFRNKDNNNNNNSTRYHHHHPKQFTNVNIEKIGDHNRDKEKRKNKLDVGYNSLGIGRKDFLPDTQSKMKVSSVKALSGTNTTTNSQKKMSIPRYSHPSLSTRPLKT